MRTPSVAFALCACALVLAAAPPSSACTSSPGFAGPPVQLQNPLSVPGIQPPPPGMQQTIVSAHVGVFAPSSPTECVCGLGLGSSGTGLPESANVSQVVITRYNTQTGQHTILTEFVPLSLNSLTGVGLLAGPGQAFPGSKWFGFSGYIQPFTTPGLAPNEVFTMNFALNFDPADLAALPELPLQFAAGLGDGQGLPNFFDQLHPVTYFSPGKVQPCVPTETALCLNKARFRVEMDWRSQTFPRQPAKVARCATSDSGEFFFLNPNNIEALIKILNACTLNDRYWVFYSASTNVEFKIVVTDTKIPRIKRYENPLGKPAPPIQDTEAFATCP